jgi:hypothetical protein
MRRPRPDLGCCDIYSGGTPFLKFFLIRKQAEKSFWNLLFLALV